jgi:thiamine biosynthesis lipoprotein
LKNRQFSINKQKYGYGISFYAMASACEVIIESNDEKKCYDIGNKVTQEVWRIEDKYNRYDQRSLCSAINNSKGKPIEIDEETFALLNFADTCYQLSNGVFDITSGVLRNVWRFDGSDNIPSEAAVKRIMRNVGWTKISFTEQHITLPDSMEIDFGGIGKEYAVDKVILLIKSLTNAPALVNLGGDLATTSARKNNQAWQVGVEHPGFENSRFENPRFESTRFENSASKNKQTMVVSLFNGALATSGDAKRFLLKAGKRYSHILNAKTGWPIEDAPRSITVSAPQCIQAGILATLAQMQGVTAEDFLTEQNIKHWSIR